MSNGMRPRAPSGVCCEAIQTGSAPSPSRRTAGLSCRALATRRSAYGMRPQAPSGTFFLWILIYSFSHFPLVVNISLPIVEPCGCLTPTADVRIIYLPQDLGLPTMATSYFISSTQTIRTYLVCFGCQDRQQDSCVAGHSAVCTILVRQFRPQYETDTIQFPTGLISRTRAEMAERLR
jgi:hypothetical protein